MLSHFQQIYSVATVVLVRILDACKIYDLAGVSRVSTELLTLHPGY